jgi:hypothetical protein
MFISKDAWIGANATIMLGVTVGVSLQKYENILMCLFFLRGMIFFVLLRRK